MKPATVRLEPATGPLGGVLAVPGDKSIAHRALLFNAIASGEAVVGGLPEGLDVASTIGALRVLGVEVENISPGVFRISGCGMRLRAPSTTIDCGNSGTTMRLLAGVLAGQDFESVLDGDVSLRARPMARVADPLSAMGARVEVGSAGCAPMRIRPGKLRALAHELPVASAQVKSALLLAGLQTRGRTCVREPRSSRDHTERLLATMGVRLECDRGRVCVEGPSVPVCQDVSVPGDPSSAAFFVVAATVVPGSQLRIQGVCLNPTRMGFIRLLERMGADIETHEVRHSGGEEIGDLYVRHARLSGIEIAAEDIPAAVDELPVLAVAAALAGGTTTVRGAAELRVKESDRITAITTMLTAFGIEVTEFEDGFSIRGGTGLAGGARLSGEGDHRMVMAGAIAALRADGPTTLENPAVVSVSFPGFFESLGRLRA